jgi:RNA polymerase sigma-70 factor (ECF subfamily)
LGTGKEPSDRADGQPPRGVQRSRHRRRGAPRRDEVWRALYEAHFDAIYRLTRRLGAQSADAEDLAQRIFLRAHDLLRGSDEILHPLAWLRAIAVRVVAEHHRFWRLRRLKAWLLEATLEAQQRPPPTPADEVDAADRQRHVADVLAAMSPKLREVLVLAELEDCAPSEVAAILDIPVNTVRSRRLLARKDFERRWTRRFGGAP